MVIQELMNNYLKEISNTIEDEILKMIKSIGYEGINNLEEIKKWLEYNDYELYHDNWIRDGDKFSEYGIRKDHLTITRILFRDIYDNFEFKLQLYK